MNNLKAYKMDGLGNDFIIFDEREKSIALTKDQIIKINAPYEPISALLKPAKNMDIGAGAGEEVKTDIYGGTVGIIFDCRDRPINIPSDPEKRLESLRSWSRALNEYPEE